MVILDIMVIIDIIDIMDIMDIMDVMDIINIMDIIDIIELWVLSDSHLSVANLGGDSKEKGSLVSETRHKKSISISISIFRSRTSSNSDIRTATLIKYCNTDCIITSEFLSCLLQPSARHADWPLVNLLLGPQDPAGFLQEVVTDQSGARLEILHRTTM